MPGRALILFGHGARDPEWAAPFHALRALLLKKDPGLAVELAFLEIMTPTLEQAVSSLAAAGHTQISVAPLFIAQGGHLKQDLPRRMDAARAAHAGVTLDLLPPLGEVDSVRAAIVDWLAGSA